MSFNCLCIYRQINCVSKYNAHQSNSNYIQTMNVTVLTPYKRTTQKLLRSDIYNDLYHAYYRMLQIFLFITTFYCWFHSPFFYNSFSKDMFHYHCNFLQYLPYFYHTYVSKFVWGYTCGIFAEPKTQRKVVVLLVIINFKEILMSCQQRYTKYPADVGNEYCATWANNTSHVKLNATQGNIKTIW